MVDTTLAPGVLVEPGAPPWAQRLVLRLQQMFLPQTPVQPMFLKGYAPGALPPAANWPGAMAGTTDGGFWVSDGTSWNRQASAAQIGNFVGMTGLSGTVTLTPSQVGRYLAAIGALTLTLPLTTAVPVGGAVWLQNATTPGVVSIARQGADNLFNPTSGNVTSYTVPAGKFVLAVNGGGATWYLSGSGF